MNSSIDRIKFYDAIYDFLCETLNGDEVSIKATLMVDNIEETLLEINTMLFNDDINNISAVSTKLHSVKNLLLYGDFYYESDLCQDMELELRKGTPLHEIRPMFDDLMDSLKNQ
jgi:hypothetical protein